MSIQMSAKIPIKFLNGQRVDIEKRVARGGRTMVRDKKPPSLIVAQHEEKEGIIVLTLPTGKSGRKKIEVGVHAYQLRKAVKGMTGDDEDL